MKFIIFIFSLLLVSVNANVIQKALDNGLDPLSLEMVNLINSLNLTWKAKYYNDKEHIFKTSRCFPKDLKPTNSSNYSSNYSFESIDDVTIPEVFDARNVWPECSEIIGDIKDQGACASCWAVSSTSVMSDSICIASHGADKAKISAYDLMSCHDNKYNCDDGGSIYDASKYWENEGIVTGGNYGEKGTCRPYEIDPKKNSCYYGFNSTKYSGDCIDKAKVLECKRECDNGANYKNDKHFGKLTLIDSNEKEIQKNIMVHGSVVTSFEVYKDFGIYGHGVYESTMNEFVGCHSVKILGWGVEDHTKYWLIANSWGKNRDINGYVKFKRGDNHCGIETEIFSPSPEIKSLKELH